MSEFEETRERRNRFSQAVYALGKDRPARIVALEDVGTQLGMDANDFIAEDELIDIARYLEDRGLIKGQADGYGLLSITSNGIDKVEESALAHESSSPTPRTWYDVLYGTSSERGETSQATKPPVEISESLEKFREDYPDPAKIAFIMMRFGTTKAHDAIAEAVREGLATRGISGVRADGKQYHNDLLYNILTYMHGCGQGVAVFERIEAETHNPNVALEVGYMFALRKEVCYLKDRTLPTLQADLVGRLYAPFDPQDPSGTIPPLVEKWMSDRGLPARP